MRHPLPYAFAKAHQVLLQDDGRQRVLWTTPATPLSTLSEVLRVHAVDVWQHEAAPSLQARIAAAYAGGESSAAAVVGEVESAVDLSRLMQELPAVEDLLEAADDAPIIRMLNALLTQGVRDGASDIHIEPYERSSAVRFRVDGTLREVVQPNKALHAALISRLKIMAELDISEKRLPQDGRISLRLGTRAIDVRVSTLPGAHGERAVLRLLDKSGQRFTLEALLFFAPFTRFCQVDDALCSYRLRCIHIGWKRYFIWLPLSARLRCAFRKKRYSREFAL
jgi:general secretion pathway protein E